MNYRVSRLTDLVYESAVIPENFRGLLSGEERIFNEGYNELLAEYCDGVGVAFLEYSGGVRGGDGSALPSFVEIQVEEERGGWLIMGLRWGWRGGVDIGLGGRLWRGWLGGGRLSRGMWRFRGERWCVGRYKVGFV